ncbi:MAG: hypothetical protein DRR11_02135 [Gammaproteobacteria bacterium]|nr:MAG: hypothetical protein DRR15_09200 [Gammaproteobacteria bacterium]RLA34693.1 MAG: hypothetical protein DRR11_02135 [Gammaproteobacteria bacterium]
MRLRSVKLVLVMASLLVAAAAQAQSVSRSTFNVLQRVQKIMEEERYADALAELEVLVVDTQNNPYDNALANQYLAHTSIMLDNPQGTRAALEAGLANTGLPEDMRAEMNLFYGTVLLGEEEYELARIALADWIAVAAYPQPSQIFSFAYANYMSGNVAQAEPLVDRAIGSAVQPLEPWYQLYYRILFDLKKFELAGSVLHGMISRNPANQMYWRMLVSHYQQLERPGDALATIMTAYLNGSIDSQSDFKQIVSLYGYLDAPEKGARMLQEWLANGELPSDPKILKQLGNLWLMARERESAVVVLKEAATLAPDGRTFELLGGIYFEEEEWPEAYTAYQNAIRVGGLEEPFRISLLAGISAMRAEQTEDARISLEIAAESEQFKKQAEALLKRLDDG